MPIKKKSSASKSPKATAKTLKKDAKKTDTESYNSSSITVLKGLEAVKKDQECILETPMMERVYITWFTR